MRRDLVANASHELRTPIGALRARLENLVDGVEPPDARRCGRCSCRSSGSAASSSSCSSSRSSSRARRRSNGTRSRPHAARPRRRRLARRGPRPRGAVRRQRRAAALRVDGDGERIHQVLTNLVGNAVRHSPASGCVWLRARRLERRAPIEVVDEGPGIDAGRGGTRLRALLPRRPRAGRDRRRRRPRPGDRALDRRAARRANPRRGGRAEGLPHGRGAAGVDLNFDASLDKPRRRATCRRSTACSAWSRRSRWRSASRRLRSARRTCARGTEAALRAVRGRGHSGLPARSLRARFYGRTGGDRPGMDCPLGDCSFGAPSERALLEAPRDELTGAAHVLDHATPRCNGVVPLDRVEDRLVLGDILIEQTRVLLQRDPGQVTGKLRCRSVSVEPRRAFPAASWIARWKRSLPSIDSSCVSAGGRSPGSRLPPLEQRRHGTRKAPGAAQCTSSSSRMRSREARRRGPRAPRGPGRPRGSHARWVRARARPGAAEPRRARLACSLRSASRTGVRETPNSAASDSWRSPVPVGMSR